MFGVIRLLATRSQLIDVPLKQQNNYLTLKCKVTVTVGWPKNCWDGRPFPSPPTSMLRYRAIGPVRRPKFVLEEGDGIISSSHVTSTV